MSEDNLKEGLTEDEIPNLYDLTEDEAFKLFGFEQAPEDFMAQAIIQFNHKSLISYARSQPLNETDERIIQIAREALEKLGNLQGQGVDEAQTGKDPVYTREGAYIIQQATKRISPLLRGARESTPLDHRIV